MTSTSFRARARRCCWFGLAFAAGCFATPAAAHRVVTLAPNLAQLACAAGGCDQIVGVSAHTDTPSQVAKLPRVGNAWGFDYEAILALHPDLVLAWAGGTPPSTIARLRTLGLSVRVVAVHRLDDIPRAVEDLGTWLGTRAHATAAANTFRTELAALRARYASAAPLRVFFQIGTTPAYTVNGDSPISAALAVCGGVNVFSDLSSIAAPVSAEAVLASRPQVVLYGKDTAGSNIRAYWARLPSAPAAVNGDIFPVDIADLTGTPRVIDGIRHVCTLFEHVRARAARHRSAQSLSGKAKATT